MVEPFFPDWTWRRDIIRYPRPKDDIPKTEIITHFSLFEFLYMPYGLKNAVQTFLLLMDSLFRQISLSFSLINLDDLLIFSNRPFSTFQEIVST